MADAVSTPINTITRENLTVLITNNILNNSVEFVADCDLMETVSPVRKPLSQPIGKKLFHSPMSESPKSPNEVRIARTSAERSRKAFKRRQTLIPECGERIKRAYVRECEDSYSPNGMGGMRKKVLISLFHNKEYCMDLSV